ncbi:MAG: SWIM zinc finger family protein, partial [Actinomycetia bacterium]|nr:SWIM zinc finger family protein [Actinomycetes bacterium]
MVDWTAVLSDSAIEAAVGTPAYHRGLAYARNGHVGHLKVNRNVIFGRVHGTAPDPYQLIVVAGQDRAVARVSATCTCPVGVDCKHAAAAMIAAREHVSQSAGTRSPTWRQTLDALVESHTAPADLAPLALQFTVEVESASAYDPELTGTRSLIVRPLAMGKRGRWVRTGASWRDMQRPWGSAKHRPEHVDVLHRMNALSDGMAYLISDAAGVELGEFGPSVWRLLAEARDAGVEFVSAAAGLYVELSDTPAVACLDTARDPHTGGLAITPALRIGDETVELGAVEPVGWPVHGALRVTDSALELFPLAEPPSERLSALFGRSIEVPADEVDSFLTDYYPALGRVVPLTSADASVALPEIAAPRLRAVADFQPEHELRLSWA